MTYTPNTPQGNQTIASTTDPIRNNFQFIQTDMRVEHVFNGNVPGVAEGVHTKVTMPNMADPVPGSLPTGTDGMFYIRGGGPRYFNNVDNFTIQTTPLFQNVLFGTIALNNSGFSLISLLSAYSQGYYTITPTNGSGISAQNASAMGFFCTSASALQPGLVSDPGIDILPGGLNLFARTSSSSFNGNYNYVVVYWTVP